MKKMVLLAALTLGMIVSAQDEVQAQKQNVFSPQNIVTLQTGFVTTIGLAQTVDKYFKNQEVNPRNEKFYYINFVLTGVDPGSTLVYDKIQGASIGIGMRKFYGKNKDEKKGFFTQGTLEFLNVRYRPGNIAFNGADGRYIHFTFINPTIGYRFTTSEKTRLQFYGGVDWVIQFKSSGNIESRDISNWQPKLGASFLF